MSSNFGKWRFEKKPLLISLLFGAISLFLLLMISNLEFVKESIPARRYRLETEPENARAAALYRRHGFEHFEYVNYKLDR